MLCKSCEHRLLPVCGSFAFEPYPEEKIMSQTERYDDLILGGGEAGKYLAWHLAKSGRHCAVIERRLIGGSCPNTNCLPSKNEIWSAKVAHLARTAAQFGTRTGPITIDMAGVLKRKRDMVADLIALNFDRYQASGTELIMGEGHFTAPKTLEARLNNGEKRVLTGERVFINVGTHATIPDVPGLADAQPLTNIEILELDHLPEHLVVSGGGFVGLELAQTYRRFGSRVTVIERGPQILSHEDSDVADEIQRAFGDEGIEVLLATDILRVQGRSGEGVKLLLWGPQGERTLDASDILAANGRTPNTAGIGLDAAGVALDARLHPGQRPVGDERTECLGAGRVRR
jgi:pyruvate/2-oxoglutarate dehydrogenase complex dihydrolipoamide dehydrogenase (E3) component